MTDGNLVARLLNLDILVGLEARRLDLEDQLTVDTVGLALVRWALHNRVELFLVNELVDFETAAVAGVDRHLHAWPHVTCPRHDTAHSHQITDILCPNIAHLNDVLLAEFTRYEDDLIVALKFCRDSCHWVSVSAFVFVHDETLLLFDLNGLLQVVATLVHDNIEAGEVFFTEVETWVGHVHINHFVENLAISRRIFHDALNETMVAVRTDTKLTKWLDMLAKVDKPTYLKKSLTSSISSSSNLRSLLATSYC